MFAEIFPEEGKAEILPILFRLLTMECKWTFTKRFNISTPQSKCPILRQQSQKLLFVGRNAFSLLLLFAQYKTALPLSAVIVSLHFLQRCLRSTVTCGKMPTTITRVGLSG